MDFFFTMDPSTMYYLGYTAAAIATMGLAYWTTKGGISALNLEQDDLKLIASGVFKGALHSEEGMTTFLQCVDDPNAVITKFEGAVADFQKEEMIGVTAGLFKIGDAVSDLAKGIQQCDDSVKTREMEILANMYDAFKHPKSLAQEA